MQRNNLVFPKSLYPLWFFSCFAGLQALTGAATDDALENFFFFLISLFSSLSLFLFFSPFKICLCPSHHCLTSDCQSLHSQLGDAMCSHFHFNHSLWGLEGNLEVTKPSSHRGSVFSSCNRQAFSLSVDTSSFGKLPVLYCSPYHYGSTPVIRDLSDFQLSSVSWWHPAITVVVSGAVQNKSITS